MTEGSVALSITIKVEDVIMEMEEQLPVEALEDAIQSVTVGVGRRVLSEAIRVLDDRLMREVPAGWRNVGTEMRWMVSSLGAVRYRRWPEATSGGCTEMRSSIGGNRWMSCLIWCGMGG